MPFLGACQSHALRQRRRPTFVLPFQPWRVASRSRTLSGPWGTQLGTASSSVQRSRTWQLKTGHRSEEHTSELQSLMRTSYAVFCLKKKKNTTSTDYTTL